MSRGPAVLASARYHDPTRSGVLVLHGPPVADAPEPIDDTSGVEVEDWTASVQYGGLTESEVTVEIAFPVEHETA